MSIIKHVALQKIVTHDFRYDPRILAVVLDGCIIYKLLLKELLFFFNLSGGNTSVHESIVLKNHVLCQSSFSSFHVASFISLFLFSRSCSVHHWEL